MNKFVRLSHGSHREGVGVGCAMEAISAINGGRWTDHPECVCPVITAFVIVFNDLLPSDELRSKYLAPRLLTPIGTRGTLKDEIARAKIASKCAGKFYSLATNAANATSDDSLSISCTASEAARYAANNAVFAAFATNATREKIYDLCAECIDEMIKAGPHAPEGLKMDVSMLPKLMGEVEVA